MDELVTWIRKVSIEIVDVKYECELFQEIVMCCVWTRWHMCKVRGISSVGRARASHAWGRRFDSGILQILTEQLYPGGCKEWFFGYISETDEVYAKTNDIILLQLISPFYGYNIIWSCTSIERIVIIFCIYYIYCINIKSGRLGLGEWLFFRVEDVPRLWHFHYGIPLVWKHPYNSYLYSFVLFLWYSKRNTF